VCFFCVCFKILRALLLLYSLRYVNLFIKRIWMNEWMSFTADNERQRKHPVCVKSIFNRGSVYGLRSMHYSATWTGSQTISAGTKYKNLLLVRSFLYSTALSSRKPARTNELFENKFHMCRHVEIYRTRRTSFRPKIPWPGRKLSPTCLKAGWKHGFSTVFFE